MSGAWPALLAAYASSLDDMERWLDARDTPPPLGWREPQELPATAPTAEERAHMASLLGRSARLADRLERELAGVDGELRGERRRRVGRQAYRSAPRAG